MREIRRQIAKARMEAAGVGNINKKMSKTRGGVKIWRILTEGKTGKQAEKEQMAYGEKIVFQRERRKLNDRYMAQSRRRLPD